MLPALLLACLSFQAAPAAGPDPEVPVAVLRSGLRVQCLPGTVTGDRLVRTPFGRLDASRDPVVAVADAAGEVALLRGVRTSDPAAWTQRLADRGLLGELAAATDEAFREAPQADHILLLDALAGWGARLDPIPAKLPFEQRVAWLWQQIQQAGPAQAALLGARVAAEIPGPSAPFDRRIGLVELRRALRQAVPGLRRAVGGVAVRQAEIDLRPALLRSSLDDPLGDVRTTSARALARLGEQDALGRWTLAMWREGREPARIHAVEHLGRFGNEQTVDALMTTLAAFQAQGDGHHGTTGFTFFGRQISLVRDFNVEVAQAAVIADPVVDVVQEGTALQVRVMSAGTIRAVTRSLADLTGARPGPRAADWLAWYEQRKAAAES